ncbi:hypothetical protein FHS95_000948 [Sphingomonas naasensis]|uniref:TonB C-terminal domain-containing protein n=1 Tax=Sphingomonas naasensis TaxID=1344951 RepID=A0A4S1WUL4_9SPHN|nr:hypothetical protein [Sphingomonas naasensis]NIJ19279.1 hypothetical protein [Sphingomonas naasensis]TGX46455.1 hypothetical protein E5A74_04730 [Sphingomonas naasensis]
MIAALALAAALQTAPLDWKGLAPLPWRAPPLVTPEMHAFVRREAIARKCPLAKPGAMEVEVAVLVDEANGIRTAVPRAIRCPTVEQYAAALVASFARNNLLPRSGTGQIWYRAQLSFSWTP